MGINHKCTEYIVKQPVWLSKPGLMGKSSANGLVGTGFASWYQLQPRAGFFNRPVGRCKDN